MNNAIGLLTPPWAPCSTSWPAWRADLGRVTRGVWPFLVAQAVLLLLFIMFPALVMVPARWFY